MVESTVTNNQLLKKIDDNGAKITKNCDGIYRLEEKYKKFEDKISHLYNHTYKLDLRLTEILEQLSYLPVLYDKVDKLVGEIVDHRQERTILSNRIEDHEDGITRLEKR